VSTESQGLGVVATEPLLAGQLVTEEATGHRKTLGGKQKPCENPWENGGNHRKTIGNMDLYRKTMENCVLRKKHKD